MENKSSVKQQELGLKIAAELCSQLNYSTTNSLNISSLKKEFSSTDKTELINVIAYLKQKKYVKYSSFNNEPYEIYLTEKGVDLVETLESNKVFSRYSADFSTEVLQNMRSKLK
ncbi:MAG: hypothetical protein FWB73_08940 [Treponema sp.]|nr:hypothetical protein [Treponema sp.]MCL2176155.1 hypothetical protein [Treponema sp.]